MNNHFDFRSLLLRIQDLLSDNDRQRLHFLLGDDVPRHLREDPSINGSLRVLESLLDKAIITEEDCDYLIEAFKNIQCQNAAKRLEEYQQVQRTDGTKTVCLQSILLESYEKDKFSSKMLNTPVVSKFDKELIVLQEFSTNGKNVQQSTKSEKVPINVRSILNSIVQHSLTPREIFCLVLIIVLILMFVTIMMVQKKKENHPIKTFNLSCYTSCASFRWIQNGSVLLTTRYDQPSYLLSYTGLTIVEEHILLAVNSGANQIMETRYSEAVYIAIHGNEGAEKVEKLDYPTSVIVDKEDQDNLIICDQKNKRIVRWSRVTNKYDETLLKNIDCSGLAMDEKGYLYVAEIRSNSVRRYRIGEKNRTVVAGGNGMGNDLHQLNRPSYLFVDKNQSIYISDTDNHRVMKWLPNASHGIIVAGGRGEGNSLTQLSYPTGLFVDSIGTLYISDKGNHRVMRWCNGATQGSIVVGGNGQGNLTNQLNGPQGLTIDVDHNLFVADSSNSRVLSFRVHK